MCIVTRETAESVVCKVISVDEKPNGCGIQNGNVELTKLHLHLVINMYIQCTDCNLKCQWLRENRGQHTGVTVTLDASVRARDMLVSRQTAGQTNML